MLLFRIVPITAIAVAALVVSQRQQREGYRGGVAAYNSDYPAADDGALPPWQRHAVWMGADSDPRDDYPAAFYHTEYDDDFERDLCAKLGCAEAPAETWGPIEGAEAEPGADAQAAYEAVAGKVRGAFPDPWQVLHERWTSWRASPATPKRYEIVAEFVVFRPPAHHAKHIRVTAVVQGQKASVVSAIVAGNLSQDQFALLPVVAANMLAPYTDVDPAFWNAEPATDRTAWVVDAEALRLVYQGAASKS